VSTTAEANLYTRRFDPRGTAGHERRPGMVCRFDPDPGVDVLVWTLEVRVEGRSDPAPLQFEPCL
jgi:hypothetical protein